MVRVATYFAMTLGAFVFWQSMDRVHVWIALRQDEKVRFLFSLISPLFFSPSSSFPQFTFLPLLPFFSPISISLSLSLCLTKTLDISHNCCYVWTMQIAFEFCRKKGWRGKQRSEGSEKYCWSSSRRPIRRILLLDFQHVVIFPPHSFVLPRLPSFFFSFFQWNVICSNKIWYSWAKSNLIGWISDIVTFTFELVSWNATCRQLLAFLALFIFVCYIGSWLRLWTRI